MHTVHNTIARKLPSLRLCVRTFSLSRWRVTARTAPIRTDCHPPPTPLCTSQSCLQVCHPLRSVSYLLRQPQGARQREGAQLLDAARHGTPLQHVSAIWMACFNDFTHAWLWNATAE